MRSLEQKLDLYKSKPVIHPNISIILKHDSKTDLNISNVLDQTCKVKNIVLIVSEGIGISDTAKRTCCIQVSGGPGMLIKERESDSILMYSKQDKVILTNSTDLSNLINLCLKQPYAMINGEAFICITTNIPLGIDDLYTNKYGTYWV